MSVEVKRLGRFARLVTEKSESADFKLALEHVEGWTGRLSTDAEAIESASEELGGEGIRFRHGDVLFGKLRPYLAKAWVADRVGAAVGDFHVYRATRDVHPRFLLYSLLRSEYIDEVNASTYGSKMPRASWEYIKATMHYVPELGQQRRIAEFLDRETAQIDELIAKQQQLISTLAERERETLRHAMLTASAEAPTVAVSMLASVGNGSTPSRGRLDYWADGSIPWLNSSVANADYVLEPSDFVSEAAFRECHLPMVAPGSTLVGLTGQGRTRGMATRLGITATVSQHLAYVTPGRRLHAEFLYWALANEYEQFRETSDGNGGTKGGLTCEAIRRTKIPVPDLERQADISFGLQSAAETATKVRHRVASAIDLLRERRQALISAAVTGQIDVGGGS